MLNNITNIIKRFNIDYLLTLPFIIVPFLITHRFQDSTLLIKRTSLFLIFLFIAILFLIVKTKINSIGSIHKIISSGIMIFIGYLFIVASFNSINIIEAYWGILYLCGWLGVYGLFVLFANQSIMKQIIYTTSIIGGLLSILIPIDAINNLPATKNTPQNGCNYHHHSNLSYNSSEIIAPDGTSTTTKIFDNASNQDKHAIRFGYRFKSITIDEFTSGETLTLKVGETYTFSTHIFIPSDLSSTEQWNRTGFTSIKGKQSVKDSDWEINACLLNEEIYRSFTWNKSNNPDTGWEECVDNLNGITGQSFPISNQINADLSLTDQWQRISGSFTVDDPLKHGDFYSIKISLGNLGKGPPKTDHFLYVWGGQIEQGNNLTEYDDTFSASNLIGGDKRERFYSYFINSISKLSNQINVNLPSSGGLSSTFGYRNFFSMYLCFVIPASLISMFLINKRWLKVLHTMMLFFSSVALILTRTRAAWFGIFIVGIIFLFIYRHILINHLRTAVKNRKILIFSLVLLVAFIAALLIPVKSGNKQTVMQTIGTLNNLKTDRQWGNRLTMYSSTIKMIKDNPLFGVGIENWRINYPQYAGSIINDDNFQIIRQRPHNDLLWITAEIGIIGLFFVFSFFIFHLKPAVRPIMNIKNKDPTDIQLINTFIILSILAIVIESMFDFPKQRVMPNLYVWSGLGFLGNQIIQNNKKNLKVGKIFQYGIVFIMIFISFAMYKDYRSNTYSQDAKYYNNNSMPNELYSSSEIALNYYRNMDVEGTPLYYYMGIAKYKLGDLNSASSLFKKALNIAPYHIGALMNYLIVLGQLDELESAYNIMLVIQDVYPNMAKPRLDMAKFLINASLQDQAGKILMEMKDNNIDDKSRTRDKLLSLIK